MQEYIDNGAILGFLIDRKAKAVYLYRPQQATQILENPTEVQGDSELPGFTLQMSKIW
jgi:Uma2 family endonuclease